MPSRKKKRSLPPLPRVPPAIVVRMFLLASVAVIACIWALVRFYRHARAPMVTPAQRQEQPHQAPAEHPGEIPAPPLVPVD